MCMNDKIDMQLWAEDVKNRDGWECVICGLYGRGNVKAHHILFQKNFPQLKFNLNNGITLCERHEAEIHETE